LITKLLLLIQELKTLTRMLISRTILFVVVLSIILIKSGLKIHHDGDLPARSGISSSSSFTVGLLHALYAMKHQMVSPKRLTEEAIDVEQNWLNESVGIQDQIMAVQGGFQIIEM
jgi:D-glycero-alpha-D-manno-heptose-7-phosphate kinase